MIFFIVDLLLIKRAPRCKSRRVQNTRIKETIQSDLHSPYESEEDLESCFAGFIANRPDCFDQVIGLDDLWVVLDFYLASIEKYFGIRNTLEHFKSSLNLSDTRRAGKFLTA
jgi:hypothetical protein